MRNIINLFESVNNLVSTLGLPENWNPNQIEPALMTFKEYHDLVNPNHKSHSDSSYDITLEQLNRYTHKDEYKIIRQTKINGVEFKIGLNLRKYGPAIKTDLEGMPLRVNDELQYYSEEEAIRLGYHRYGWDLAVFDGDECVARVQDEWGCVLVVVAREYRGFGLGPILVKIARSIQPDKSSGGFTPSGHRNLIKVYREFVRDALKNGMYRSLFKEDKISYERIKEIVDSAGLDQKKKPEPVDLNSKNPKDWLLHVGDYGDFVIYDKKLKNVVNNGGKFEYFAERMIKGMAYVSINEGREGDWAMLRRFGGDSDTIKKFLMNCAIEYARRNQVPLFLENDEPKFVDPKMATLGEPSSMVRGFKSQEATPTGQKFPYDELGKVEAKWRKNFDKYNEFYHLMVEMAYSKYQTTAG